MRPPVCGLNASLVALNVPADIPTNKSEYSLYEHT